ncbi:MbcA/ParS/Xre antitoxin family protein [Occallatibacter riparius]|uniref:MbcA/ParS/Xre antitoxin family protein n=1 Tax=Occallatibacter riparius TaxID=1002689 RepID=A0A9J7BQK7_9BACT|nr:MbcA/ParS/Xre antitoxin family protein [Occallatibacter riparius]UWZ85156.1 MbcA/ParS/Xre antitoxin family protein [Occallatibacter riparius]
MATQPSFAPAGYQFDTVPDLSRLETRERLSQSAVDGLLAIADKWGITTEKVGDLLGGLSRATIYKMKTAAGVLKQDELTRISYVVGIYKALHILLPDDWADQWMTRPNDNILFGGQTPLDFVIRNGIPGLQQVRSLLDAARGGR